jgi:hypothetical protein
MAGRTACSHAEHGAGLQKHVLYEVLPSAAFNVGGRVFTTNGAAAPWCCSTGCQAVCELLGGTCMESAFPDSW